MAMEDSAAPTVALFVTCLVDLFRPQIGFATVHLIEATGAKVVVPAGQTCCGQPALNAGARDEAKALARQTIAALDGFDAVVVPSGSCAGTIVCHYAELLADDPDWAQRAARLAQKTFELTTYLTEIRPLDTLETHFSGTVTYHDSCSGLREMGVRTQPRALLAKIDGLDLIEADNRDECCGFGGLFSVKYPEISTHLAGNKTKNLSRTGAATVLGGDLGCLMNIAGKLSREGSALEVRHVAEVLAGMTATPAIGRGGDT